MSKEDVLTAEKWQVGGDGDGEYHSVPEREREREEESEAAMWGR